MKHCRTSIVAIVLCAGICAGGHRASAEAVYGWERVQALPSGTSVNVHAKGHHGGCRIKAVDADSITCVGGDGARTEVIQKSEVKKISISHRGRSTLIGLGIGAGVGGILGAVSTGGNRNDWFYISRPEGALALGLPAAGIGALIGLGTDFSHTTIYRR